MVKDRTLERTGRQISALRLGLWQLGGHWGTVGKRDAMAVLDATCKAGATFLDTADVYGEGAAKP